MDKARYEKGAALRRQVVGDQYVDAVGGESEDPFNGPVQEYFTEFIWGGVWAREGLPLKIRSIVVISTLIASGRLHLLGVQFKAAIRNGCTLEELREVIIQCAAFTGGPSAVDAMRVANEALADEIAAARSKK
jgi:4-carboxymuconolactone decarboxylase